MGSINLHFNMPGSAILGLLALFLSVMCNAQTQEQLDSIQFIKSNAPNDSVAIVQLSQWDEQIYLTDMDLDIALYREIYNLAKENVENSGGTLHLFYMDVLATAADIIGLYYRDVGDISSSLDYYYEALHTNEKLFEMTADSMRLRGKASALTGIGTVHASLKEYEIALDFFEKALELAELTNDSIEIANTYGNTSYVYSKMIEDAKGYQKDSLIVLALQGSYEVLNMNLKIQNYIGAAQSHNNLGGLYNRIEMQDSAMVHYWASLALSKEHNYLLGKTFSYGNIANVYWKEGNVNMAKLYADSSHVLAKEIDRPMDVLASAKLLYQVHRRRNNWREALEFHEAYLEAQLTMLNEENQRSAAQSEAKYEYQKKEAVLKEKEKVQEAEIREQNATIKLKDQQEIFYIVGIVLVILFLIFLYFRWRKSQQQNRIIAEQKMQVDAAYEQLEEKNTEIVDSINYAQRIQAAILPPAPMIKAHLPESFVIYKPKDIVAGDFYWMEPQEDQVIFAAADCTGHGVPGAMVSVLCNNALNRSVREYDLKEPGAILDKTREIVISEFEKSEDDVKDGMDIALCSLSGNTLHYAGAHNALWIIRKGAEEVEEIRADKQPIGKYALIKPFTTHKVYLNPGDRFYIFSDGFADQFGGVRGKKFKSANFKRLLLSLQDKSMAEQAVAIEQAFEDWKGELEQLDDVCVMGVGV